LDKLTKRKLRSETIVTPEFARALTELSLEVHRQVGALIDRGGHVLAVVVGDAKGLFLPDLSEYRHKRDRLCGLRLVHTHLNAEQLSEDDLTDLALLRLDLVAAVEVLSDGLPGRVHLAHLLPHNAEATPWRVWEERSVHVLEDDFQGMMGALDEEFTRHHEARAAGDVRDRAVLIHVSQQPRWFAEDAVTEMRELCRSAGISIVEDVIQRRAPDPRFVVGQGRLKQIIIKAMQLGAEVLVFDNDLSPTQVKALADFTDLKVLDRTQVILDIFGQRALTREGRIQVELAQLRYLLPRLSGKHTAMSRLTGGIGGRGPGETKLEIDRRRAQDRIALLAREVDKLGDRRRLRRQKRTKKDVPIVSVVGYTNAGKSTLLNNLTESSVMAEDVLFATLNPVSRRLRFPEEREVVVTDTVGFIRELPGELKEAFRTTFEELHEADLLVHVVDASSAELEMKMATVQHTLAELGLDEKPVLLVLNKADLCDPEVLTGLTFRYGGIPACALDRETFEPLLAELKSRLWLVDPVEAAF
jgi:GTPase